MKNDAEIYSLFLFLFLFFKLNQVSMEEVYVNDHGAAQFRKIDSLFIRFTNLTSSIEY